MELSRDSILKAVSEYPDRYDNKTLARFLQVKGPDRRLLRQLLSDMVENGLLDKSKNKTFKKTDDLPGVMVIKILDIDEHGDMIGKPEIWKKQTPAPQIIVKESSSNVRKSSRNRVHSRCWFTRTLPDKKNRRFNNRPSHKAIR
jgi:ribonuclease R